MYPISVSQNTFEAEKTKYEQKKNLIEKELSKVLTYLLRNFGSYPARILKTYIQEVELDLNTLHQINLCSLKEITLKRYRKST